MNRLLQVVSFLSVLFAFTAISAHADTQNGVTCNVQNATTFPTGGGVYPADGHLYECIPASMLIIGREESIVGAVQKFKSDISGQQGALEYLQSNGALFYHFRTQADAIAYMSGEYPNSLLVPASTTRCGYTGADSKGMFMSKRITSSIFDMCHYTRAGIEDVQNPSITETVGHEGGHAFDYTLALNSSNPGTPTSETTPFLDYVGNDLQNENAINPSPCAIFGSAVTSALEYDLQADALTPVCQGSTVQAAYKGKSITNILQLKSPYFFFPSQVPGGIADYADAWAQMFAFVTGNGRQTNFLPVTDNAFQSFQNLCFGSAVSYWKNHLAPPPVGGAPDFPGTCATYPASEWNH